MKKTIIIISTLVALLIIGVWAYLFMFDVPKNPNEVFARFGFGNENTPIDEVVVETTPTSSENQLSAPLKRLRQLTTRPVAGATFTGTGILYAEQGTGHLYHINLTSNSESLVSGTTFPGTREAVFSHGGADVVLTIVTNGALTSVLGSVSLEGGSGTIDGILLPKNSQQFSFNSATGSLSFIVPQANGTIGYSYSLTKKTRAELFRLPLRDIRIIWGSPNFVFTTPTIAQIGYVYGIKKNDLEYVTSGGLGLSALPYANGILVSTVSNGKVSTRSYPKKGTTVLQPLPLIPEKCTQNPQRVDKLYCAVPREIKDNSYPDEWYKGALSYSDALWEFSVNDGSATALSDFLTESGREIDVLTIGTDGKGERIYFVNKNDNTLWMFDTTIQPTS